MLRDKLVLAASVVALGACGGGDKTAANGAAKPPKYENWKGRGGVFAMQDRMWTLGMIYGRATVDLSTGVVHVGDYREEGHKCEWD